MLLSFLLFIPIIGIFLILERDKYKTFTPKINDRSPAIIPTGDVVIPKISYLSPCSSIIAKKNSSFYFYCKFNYIFSDICIVWFQ